MKGCIVLIIGLPASGKSTFTTRLVNYINRNHVDMKCLYLDFDKVIPLEKQKLIVNQLDSSSSSSWKENRKYFISSCETYLSLLINSPNSSHGSIPINETTKYLEKIIQQIPLENIEHFDYFCLIVEDNFYYKSMREQFFRLSRQFKLGLSLITINTPIDSCLRRNKIRSNFVDEKIIIRMADRFERPKKDEFGVNVGNEIQLMEISYDDDDDDQLEDENYDVTIRLIRKACETPIENQIQDDDDAHNQQESREMSRKVTANNLVHRFDKLLRLSVNRMMVNPMVVNCNHGNIGKQLSSIRKVLLKKFLNNQLDPDFGEALIKEETLNQRLIEMVCNLIESQLEERKTLIIGGSGGKGDCI
ncbi:L-seryl-tRNA(Sec) kinase-like [Panonychus citri]|uniref:L-seryl-tRNA(Sec) kinase-like n=1 Tax=Panonychus citri TaxID=50023 RepID=UPI002306F319|nr:L-seryl-tRNA(Sec) kinase-like [Panonychus citri]